jgi:hypothetical protein
MSFPRWSATPLRRIGARALFAGALIATPFACSAQGGRFVDDSSSGGDGGRGGQGGGRARSDAGTSYVTQFPDALAPSASGGNGDPAMVCGMTTFDLGRLPPEVMLVLDRSGSMRRTPAGDVPMGGEADKWTQALAAIDRAVTQTQDVIEWGIGLFPLPVSRVQSDPNRCKGDLPPSIAPAASNHDAVMNEARTHAPVIDVGATPTRYAVIAARTFLQARTTKNPKAIVLTTDGVPNCADGDDSKPDVDETVAAVSASAAAGIPVYVIGLSLNGADGHDTLNRLADAGGVARAGAADHFYAVTDPTAFDAALQAIAGRVASCTFALDHDPPSPDDVAVKLDGQRIPRADGEGWSYGSGNRTVVLSGSWCEKAKMQGAGKVSIVLGCPGMPPL